MKGSRSTRVGGNHVEMWRNNLGHLADLVLDNPDGISRAELARRSGLTRSTVSRLIQDLLDLKLVTERELTGRGDPGRPATPLTAAPGTYAGIGATVNLDYLSVRAIDLQGNVVVDHHSAGEYRDSNPAEVLRVLGAQIEAAMDSCQEDGIRVVGVGIGIPGLVDRRHSDAVLQNAPNLGWRHIVPATYLGGRLADGGTVVVDNDANLQAIAAAYERPGASRGLRDFLYVSGDVGVGSAIVNSGEVYRGVHGWAGELGHTLVDPGGAPCACGARGCLETFVGKEPLYRAAGLAPDAPNGTLARALNAGDARALEAVAAGGRALGIALANAINLLDLSTVVLGTGLARIAEWLRPEVMAVLDRRLIAGRGIQVELIAAERDNAPASTGAAYLALDGTLAHALALAADA